MVKDSVKRFKLPPHNTVKFEKPGWPHQTEEKGKEFAERDEVMDWKKN